MTRKRILKETAMMIALLLYTLYPISVAAEQAMPTTKLIPISVFASSSKENTYPEMVADDNPQTRWSSENRDSEWITIDLGENKTIRRIKLNWETACAEIYLVQVSRDNQKWYIVHADAAGQPGEKKIDIDPVSIRYIRVYCVKRKTEWGYSLFSFDVYPSAEKPIALETYKSESEFRFNRVNLLPHAYALTTAHTAPNGYFPIWVGNKQGYWTVAGTIAGAKESLICEDGTIELYPRGWSLMPYLYVDDKLVTAQDVKLTQALEDDYLPIPSVKWKHNGLDFDQQIFTSEEDIGDVTYMLYRLRNTSVEKKTGSIFVTFRPFQVTPSWQGEGGMVDIFSVKLEYDAGEDTILVNEKDVLRCLTAPDASGAVSYQEGGVMDFIAKGVLPPYKTVFDPWGGATAALQYDFALAPGSSVEYIFAAPLDKDADVVNVTPDDVHRKLAKTLALWKEKLNQIKIDIPDEYAVNVLRSNLAYLFINADGPVLQPGSRHYERTWIRDGCVLGIAFLRAGYREEVMDYIDWIADHQLFNGDVPCMINANGSMAQWGKVWPEYDGQGAFITLIAEYYKYTKDEAFLADKFPSVVRALEFLDYLRKKRLTDEYRNATDEKARYYGILPLSVSHEGYALPGKHSYWDDFWAIKGWREAIEMAKILGRDDLIPWMEEEEKGLRTCLLDSIEKTQKDKEVRYIPGCADLGDLDSSATSISVWPTDEYRNLPEDELSFTLDEYYDKTLLPRIAGTSDPESGYVPYEMRTATAYLILGQKQKAWTMLDHFLGVTRPHGWNHWAEVVYGNYRKPGYIGDMPHSWVGSDYINALRTVFVHEDRGKLLLGLGLREKWFKEASAIGITDFPSHYGKISYTIKKQEDNLRVKIWGNIEPPPNGIVFKSPLATPISHATLNGSRLELLSPHEITIEELPAEISIFH